METRFFANAKAFRNWLIKNHKKVAELVVGFHKVGQGKDPMTWSESVDEALCFGWIDGRRTSIDESTYQIRFTPRKPNSIWSDVNVKKVNSLIERKLMYPAGLKSFEARNDKRTGVYTHENEAIEFPISYLKKFKADKAAWKYFQALAPSYRKLSGNWVMNAKQEITRQKRLEQLIAESGAGTNQWKDNKYKK